MDALRNLAVAAAAVVALASCGEATTNHADDPVSGASSSSPSSTESASTSQSPSVATEPARSAEALFASIDAAVARETSVRQEMGNQNPPAGLVVRQEYGAGRDEAAFILDIGHDTDPFQVYRVDGLLYAKGQAPKPMSDIEPDDSASLAATLYSDVRQDFQRMARQAGDFIYVGEENIGSVATSHYRVTLTLAPGSNPAILPSQIKGPKPADLWIDTSGLPVRVDVRYSEPFGDIPGTGVSRTDYSAWSEPLNLDPENLDWE
ncbi:MAG TPA: hypothetical protein VLI04_12400 [Nocardioidaceae bacterium]|nr:hypothetical protein [Nocardioidaceae bacterium]